MKEDMSKQERWTLILILAGIALYAVFLWGKGMQSKSSERHFMDFPFDEKGYPREDVVRIEEEYYEMLSMRSAYGDTVISHELEVRKKEDSPILRIVLPRYSPIHRWSLEETEDLWMIGYREIDHRGEKGEKEILEGSSDVLQVFEVRADYDKDNKIRLKWSNINEMEKGFKEKKENYLLCIKVLRKE